MPFSVFNASGAALAQSLTDTPVGSIQPFAGASAPSGWLLCDGSEVSRTTYAELYAVLGTAYGTGNGSTTFNVPDMRGRVPVGKGTHADVDALGDNDGSSLANRRPKHQHTVYDPTHRHAPDTAGTYFQLTNNTLVTQGGSGNYGNTNIGSYTAYASTGVKVNPDNASTSSAPTDGPAYVVTNYIILASSLATRLQAAALPQYVTSLPSNPVDGQTVVYAADATNGVMWTLRYRAASSSSYKWECVGGPSITASDAASGTRTSATFGDLTVGGSTATTPSLTLPLAGDYQISFGASVGTSSVNGQTTFVQAASSTPGNDNNSIMMYSYNATGSYRDDVVAGIGRAITLTGQSANAVVKLYYKTNSGTLSAEKRWLTALPVRVG